MDTRVRRIVEYIGSESWLDRVLTRSLPPGNHDFGGNGFIKVHFVEVLMSPVDIARVCHEVNRAYCTSLGDTSQVPWDAAPTWQKESAIKGVIAKIRNPRMTAKEQHESWLAEKEADGWEYGEKKEIKEVEHVDPFTNEKAMRVVKTHPCFLPYEKLPQEQRSKDYIFGAIVLALMDH